MATSNPREIPLATDFEAWYASKNAAKVVAGEPGFSPQDAEFRAEKAASPNIGSSERQQSQILSVQERPKPATKFTLFSTLPFELRAKIWKAALPGPRVVLLESFLTPYRRPGKARRVPTSLMHVCQESRGEALRHYRPLVDGYRSRIEIRYIDPKIDTLLIHDVRGWLDTRSRGIDGPIVDSLRHIAVDSLSPMGHHIRRYLGRFIRDLIDFSNLETLTIVDMREYSTKPFDSAYFRKPFVDWPQHLTVDDYRTLTTPFFQDRYDWDIGLSRMEFYRRTSRVLMQALSINSDLRKDWKMPRLEMKAYWP
ncbi:hypothetical protein EG329_002118 [Mollisiaceae sp. DMI_Dod_QoI]|nr:hypothetical protein EG329_002118 [Helotiales sp. DMI_Dod_QoI]